MKAVILAAGRGKRLRPLTENIHKVMLPINGRPMLEYAIRTLSKNGIRDIFIVVNQRKEDIINYFGNGSELGVKIVYLNQEEPLGTADAVKCAKDLIDERFILLNGDVFFDPSIVEKMLKAVEDGLMVCRKVDNPKEFGVVKIEDSRIVKIFEKSENPPSDIANMGMYIFPREIFDAIENTKLSKRGEYELTDSIEILISRGFTIKPLIIDEFCIDIGRIEDYERAKEAAKNFGL